MQMSPIPMIQITITNEDEETIFSAMVPSVNLPALSALIFQPIPEPPKPRAQRADRGKPRGTRKPDGIEPT